jgi:hypothetical protein
VLCHPHPHVGAPPHAVSTAGAVVMGVGTSPAGPGMLMVLVTVAPYPTHSPLALCISRNSPTASCAGDTDSHRNSCSGPGASG